MSTLCADILDASASMRPVITYRPLVGAEVIVVETASCIVQDLLPLLSAGERRRFYDFHNRDAAADFAVAHALKRAVLAERIGVSNPAELRFGVGQWGKPFLLDAQQPFNLSHTHGYVAMAISAPGIAGCGVDIEAHTPRDGLDIVIGSTMTEREKIAIASAGCRQTEFYKRWTIKEAFVKSSGLGLHYPLASVCTIDDMVVDVDTNVLNGVKIAWTSTPGFSLAFGVATALGSFERYV